jgi:hypothetical protein
MGRSDFGGSVGKGKQSKFYFRSNNGTSVGQRLPLHRASGLKATFEGSAILICKCQAAITTYFNVLSLLRMGFELSMNGVNPRHP